MIYDLEERLSLFSEKIIVFVKSYKKTLETEPLLKQLLRSATSVGANYMEANQAASKKDFSNKICISRKEANESKYWLRLLSKFDETKLDDCRILWKEAHELTLILAKIYRSSKSKS